MVIFRISKWNTVGGWLFGHRKCRDRVDGCGYSATSPRKSLHCAKLHRERRYGCYSISLSNNCIGRKACIVWNVTVIQFRRHTTVSIARNAEVVWIVRLFGLVGKQLFRAKCRDSGFLQIHFCRRKITCIDGIAAIVSLVTDIPSLRRTVACMFEIVWVVVDVRSCRQVWMSSSWRVSAVKDISNLLHNWNPRNWKTTLNLRESGPQ